MEDRSRILSEEINYKQTSLVNLPKNPYNLLTMPYVFISGIPASGKSFLAKKIAQETGSFRLDTDTLREEMAKDPQLEPWVNSYWKLDEKKYLNETSCEQH